MEDLKLDGIRAEYTMDDVYVIQAKIRRLDNLAVDAQTFFDAQRGYTEDFKRKMIVGFVLAGAFFLFNCVSSSVFAVLFVPLGLLCTVYGLYSFLKWSAIPGYMVDAALDVRIIEKMTPEWRAAISKSQVRVANLRDIAQDYKDTVEKEKRRLLIHLNNIQDNLPPEEKNRTLLFEKGNDSIKSGTPSFTYYLPGEKNADDYSPANDFNYYSMGSGNFAEAAEGGKKKGKNKKNSSVKQSAVGTGYGETGISDEATKETIDNYYIPKKEKEMPRVLNADTQYSDTYENAGGGMISSEDERAMVADRERESRLIIDNALRNRIRTAEFDFREYIKKAKSQEKSQKNIFRLNLIICAACLAIAGLIVVYCFLLGQVEVPGSVALGALGAVAEIGLFIALIAGAAYTAKTAWNNRQYILGIPTEEIINKMEKSVYAIIDPEVKEILTARRVLPAKLDVILDCYEKATKWKMSELDYSIRINEESKAKGANQYGQGVQQQRDAGMDGVFFG